jgi:hypothetical protein
MYILKVSIVAQFFGALRKHSHALPYTGSGTYSNSFKLVAMIVAKTVVIELKAP